MAKTFHLTCPRINGEMRVIKVEKHPGDFVKKNEIVLIAENKDFILEIRSEVEGVISKIHAKPESIIISNELIADINTPSFENDDSQNDVIEINHKKEYFDANCQTGGLQEIAINNPRNNYPYLDKALDKYEQEDSANLHYIDNSTKIGEIGEITDLYDAGDDSNKGSIFKKILNIFHKNSKDSSEIFTSTEELNLVNIYTTYERFKDKFYLKYQTNPIIEPFFIKSAHAALSSNPHLKGDEVNFTLFESNGKIFKSHIKNIHEKNFFDLQNDIYKDNGHSSQRNMLTIISNQQSQIMFTDQKNTIIINKTMEENHSSFLTYNIDKNINSRIIHNFLEYLENPGWIFFLL